MSAAQEIEIVTPTAIEAQERAAIDMQIATARRYPRDLQVVKNKMLTMATLDDETAAACFYTLKRKEADGTEKLIQGPSVRLAEIATVCYGNIRAASQIIGNDGKKVKARGVCLDLENNVAVSMESERRITTKSGHTYGDDMQIVAANAAGAIAFRNAVFKVVPLALVKPIYEQCRQRAIGDASKVSEKWQKGVTVFGKMGVSADQLLEYIGKTSPAEVTPDDIGTLVGLYNAIRDGEQTIDEAFSKQGTAEDAQKVAEEKLAKLRAGNAAGQPKGPATITEAEQEQLITMASGLEVTQGELAAILEKHGYKRLFQVATDRHAAIVEDVKAFALAKAKAGEPQQQSGAAAPAEESEPEPAADEPPKQQPKKLQFGSKKS